MVLMMCRRELKCRKENGADECRRGYIGGKLGAEKCIDLVLNDLFSSIVVLKDLSSAESRDARYEISEKKCI